MEQKKQKRRIALGLAKAWAYSLGFTGLYRDGRRIGGNLSALANHVRRKLKDGPQNYRHETFREAVERLGLDEEHLIRQARAFNLRAHSWFAALMLSTAWLAAIPLSDAPWSHALVCVGAMSMTFAKAITNRFRFAQIRDAELYSFGPWFFSPARW